MARSCFTTGAQTLWPVNGHYYQRVRPTSSVTWSTALSQAASMSHLGRPGYLATITSAEENAFVATLGSGWIAGSDQDSEGTWRWMAGPERGQVISPTFWASGEPDSFCSCEDYLFMQHSRWSGEWHNSTSSAYIVEYECPINPSATGHCSRKHSTSASFVKHS